MCVCVCVFEEVSFEEKRATACHGDVNREVSVPVPNTQFFLKLHLATFHFFGFLNQCFVSFFQRNIFVCSFNNLSASPVSLVARGAVGVQSFCVWCFEN